MNRASSASAFRPYRPYAEHDPAGTYSAVLQYLKAIKEAGTDETEAVAKKLHEMPVNDVFARNGKVGANGRMIYDMYLMEVKSLTKARHHGTIIRCWPPSPAIRPI